MTAIMARTGAAGVRRTRARRRIPVPHIRLPWRVLAAAAVAVLVTGAAVRGVQWLRDPRTLPLRTVRIEGDFRHLSAQQLRQAVQPKATGGFFSVDVDGVRRAAEALPWVAHASVRRVWPDTLQVHVVEQRPLARWNRSRVVNVHGELFAPSAQSIPSGLPELKGPPGLEKKVVTRYRAMSHVLAPLGLKIRQLVEDSRRAWSLRLDNGVRVELGRSSPGSRLRRFARIYPKVLAGNVARLQSVDMRYSNGFAVRWDESSRPADVQHREG